MNDRMTTEQRLDFMEGQITVLKYALALLVVTHPHKNRVGQAIKNIANYPIQDISSEHFRAGIRNIVENLDDLSETALLAEQLGKQTNIIPKKSHDREHFYKYRTVKGAMEILSNLHVCCSSPLLFNDPFDTLIELRLGFDPAETARLFWERYQQIIHGGIDYECPSTTKLGWMINHFKANPDKVGPHIPFERVSDKFDSMDTKGIAERILNESNEIWISFIKNERIFCMSETHDEILMWSHYADHHRGTVIEFKCLSDQDRAFNVATKVKYVKDIPKFGTFEQWFDHSSGKKPMDNWDLSNEYSFSKSYHWQYEKEWRFALKKQSSNDELYEYRDVYPEELSAIYLGCRISEGDKQEIVQFIQRFLPHMKIYQAFTDKDEYKLYFEKIL